MMKGLFVAFLFLFMAPVHAFQCYITAVKDSCWSEYNVTIDILDYATSKALIKPVVIPRGKNWTRTSFDCKARQALVYKAQYSPPIWDNKKTNIYTSKRIWYLPEKVKEGEAAWNIPICFGNDFSSVGFPPTAAGGCRCDFTEIPDIKIKK